MCEKKGLEIITYNWSNHEFSKLLWLILFHIFLSFLILIIIIIIINYGRGVKLTTFVKKLSN